jgi:hypothetical protein
VEVSVRRDMISYCQSSKRAQLWRCTALQFNSDFDFAFSSPRANMAEHKLDPKLYKWYLDLRAFGTIPHASVVPHSRFNCIV